MDETPKPITRLAEPMDRTGPRGPNRIGVAALLLASSLWILGGVMAFAHTQMAWALGALAIAGAVAAGAATITGTVALVVARADHLERECAIWALLLAGLSVPGWIVAIVRFWRVS